MKLGDIVWLQFWDHTENSDGVSLINATGIVVAMDDLSVTLNSWWPEGPTTSNDTTRYDIVRSTICSVSVMEEA